MTNTILELKCSSPDLRLGSYAVAGAASSLRYRAFVEAVVDHTRRRLCQEVAADPTLRSDPDVVLRFVFEPLVATASDPGDAPPGDDGVMPANGRELRSPWLHMVLSRAPRLVMRATFVWNERQLLLDQAAFDGAQLRAGDRLDPLDPGRFAILEAQYRHTAGNGGARQEEDLDHIPADVAWLLKQLPPLAQGQTHATPAQRQTVIDRASSKQVIFTQGLLDRVFNTEAAVQVINGVHDMRERSGRRGASQH